MKRKWIKRIAVFCSVILCFGSLFGCVGGGSNNSGGGNSSGGANNGNTPLVAPVLETKTDLTINQEKYFLGLGEGTNESKIITEEGVTAEYVAKMSGALGSKTNRVWMHLTSIVRRQKNEEGEWTYYIHRETADMHHEFIRLLKENGVERICSHSSSLWPLPDYYYQTVGAVPDPWGGEYDEYVEWLNMVAGHYAMLQAEFPEIDYWEIHNEVNVFDSIGPLFPAYAPEDKSLGFTMYERAVVIADLCWYINRALLEVNPNAVVVTPGFVVYGGCGSFFNDLYAAIESKCLPTGQPFYDTNPDHYFGIMATHPYPYMYGIDRTIGFLDEVYMVMKDHGDAEKKMWLTETGMSPYEDLSLVYPEGEKNLEEIATLWPQWLAALKKTSYVETAFLFRVSDRPNGETIEREKTFGLFYAPTDAERPGMPKPQTLAIYKYLYGENADLTPLYWYYNQHKNQN